MHTNRILRKKQLLFLMAISSLFFIAHAWGDSCHPAMNKHERQYLIGYGSLIETESKNRTYSHTGKNIPVRLEGFQRGFFAKGTPTGFSTTYLGVLDEEAAKMNGVFFELLATHSMAAFDKREAYYCREAVNRNKIHSLINTPLPQGQYWIYVSTKDSIVKPSEKYPLVQSYVDIFLNGCLEIQDQYKLPTYASDCITTTTDWSVDWVNDRIYPRRPFIYEKNAGKIDKLLLEKLPNYFNQIKIES